MAGFDPDEFLAVAEAEETFDPDAFLADKPGLLKDTYHRIGGGLTTGVLDAGAGAARWAQMVTEADKVIADRIGLPVVGEVAGAISKEFGGVADTITQKRKEVQAYSESQRDRSRDPNFISQLAEAGGNFAGQIGLTATGKVPGIVSNVGQMFTQEYQAAKEKGADTITAYTAGVANLPAAFLDYFAESKIAKSLLPQGSRTIGDVVKKMVANAGVEGATEVLQDEYSNWLAGNALKYDQTRAVENRFSAAHLPETGKEIARTFAIGGILGAGATGTFEALQPAPVDEKGLAKQAKLEDLQKELDEIQKETPKAPEFNANVPTPSSEITGDQGTTALPEIARVRSQIDPVFAEHVKNVNNLSGQEQQDYITQNNLNPEEVLRIAPEQAQASLEGSETQNQSNEPINDPGAITTPSSDRKLDILNRATQVIREEWEAAPEIVVVPDVQSIPAEALTEGEKSAVQTQTPDGLFGRDGKVYLVGNAIDNVQRAKEIVLHETKAHYGFKSLFGKDEAAYRRAMQSSLDEFNARPKIADALAKRGGFKDVADLVKAYGHLNAEHKEGKYALTEELLSRAAEVYHDPIQQRPTWFNRIVSKVKLSLQKVMPGMQLNDQDIVNLLGDKSTKLLEAAGEVVEKGKSARVPRFSLQPEGFYGKKPAMPTGEGAAQASGNTSLPQGSLSETKRKEIVSRYEDAANEIIQKAHKQAEQEGRAVEVESDNDGIRELESIHIGNGSAFRSRKISRTESEIVNPTVSSETERQSAIAKASEALVPINSEFEAANKAFKKAGGFKAITNHVYGRQDWSKLESIGEPLKSLGLARQKAYKKRDAAQSALIRAHQLITPEQANRINSLNKLNDGLSDWGKWEIEYGDTGNTIDTEQNEQGARDNLIDRYGNEIAEKELYSVKEDARQELLNTLDVPQDMALKNVEDTKWNSVYYNIDHILTRDEDGEPDEVEHYKLSIRDHDPSPFREREFGFSNYWVEVSKEHPIDEIAAAVTKIEQWLKRKSQSREKTSNMVPRGNTGISASPNVQSSGLEQSKTGKLDQSKSGTNVNPKSSRPEGGAQFSLKPAPAVHIGDMEMEGLKLPLFNLTQDIPGHPKNSTVSADTLIETGFGAPEGYQGEFAMTDMSKFSLTGNPGVDSILESLNTKSAILERKVFDDFNALAKVEKAVNFGKRLDSSMSGWTAALQTRNLQNVMKSVFTNGMIEYNSAQGMFETNPNSPSMKSIFEPLTSKGLLPKWENYAKGLRAQTLVEQKLGKPWANATDQEVQKLTGFTKTDADNWIAEGSLLPEVVDAQTAYQKHNQAIRDFALQTGLISPAQKDAMDQLLNYVPFFRDMDKEGKIISRGKSGIAGQTSGIKEFKGSQKEILPLLESITAQASRIIDAGMKNIAGQRAVGVMQAAGVAERVPTQTNPFTADIASVVKDIEGLGVDFSKLPAEAQQNLAALLSTTTATQSKSNDPNVVTIRVNGKPQHYETKDPVLAQALESLTKPEESLLMKVIRGGKTLQTVTATTSPAFAIRNLLRDTLSVFVQSGDTKHPLRAFKGLVKSLTNGEELRAMQATGSGGSAYYNIDPKSLNKILDSDSFWKNRWNDKLWLGTVANAYKNVLHAAENANRVAVYNKVIEKGGSKAEAAFQAQDTLNFQMRGASKSIQYLASAVPFLNARLQGLYKIGRSYEEDPKGVALRGGLLVLGTLGLWALNHFDREDEDENGRNWYERLPDADKLLYWNVRMPYTKEIARIPKPFEIGTMFATVPELIADTLNDPQELRRSLRLGGHASAQAIPFFGDAVSGFLDKGDLSQAVLQSLVGNPLFKIPVELASNKNLFFNRPIVPEGKKKLPEQFQYNESTSATAKAAGEILGVSPMKADYLMNALLSGLAPYVMFATDSIAKSSGIEGAPAKRVVDYMGAGWVSRNAETMGNRYIQDFYQLKQDVDETWYAARQMFLEQKNKEALEFVKNNREKLELRGRLDATQKQLKAYSEQLMELRGNEDLDSDKKKKMEEDILKKRNALLGKTLSFYEKK